MVIIFAIFFVSAALEPSSSLTIDTQLQVIKNDCYERMAIGERLNPKDVFKTLDKNTIHDCQMACTEEGDKCRSFSFGIGVKGNASCELSMKVIKETVDLKPIGTMKNPEYDLYIKKLGCKLVLDKKPEITIPVVEHMDDSPTGPDHFSNHNKPMDDGYGGTGPGHPITGPERPLPDKQPPRPLRPDKVGPRPIPENEIPKPIDKPRPRPRPPFEDRPRPHLDDRPRPPFDERPRPPFDERPRPPFGDRPRPPLDDRPRPPLDDRPRPPFDDRPRPPFDERPRPPFDERPRPSFDDRGPRPPFDDRPRPPFDERPKPRPRPDNRPIDLDITHRPGPPYHEDREKPIKNRPPSGPGGGFKLPQETFKTNKDGTYTVSTLVAIRPALPNNKDKDLNPYMYGHPNRPLAYDRDKPDSPYDRDRPDFDQYKYGYKNKFKYSGHDEFHSFNSQSHSSYHSSSYDFEDNHNLDKPDRYKPKPCLKGCRPSRPDLDDHRPDYGRPEERPPPRPVNRPRPEDDSYNRPDDRPPPRPHRPRPEDDRPYGRPEERPPPRPVDRPRPEDDRPYGRPEERPPHRPVERPRPDDDRPYGRPEERPPHRPIDRPRPDDRPYGRPEERPPHRPVDRPRPEDDRPYSRPDERPPPRPVDRPRPEDDRPYGRPEERPPHRPIDRPRPDDDRPYGRPEERPPHRPIDRPRPDDDRPYGRPDERPPQRPPSRPRPGDDRPYGRPEERPPHRPIDRPRPDDDRPYGRPDERPPQRPPPRPRPDDDRPYGRPEERPPPRPVDRPRPDKDRPSYDGPQERPPQHRPRPPLDDGYRPYRPPFDEAYDRPEFYGESHERPYERPVVDDRPYFERPGEKDKDGWTHFRPIPPELQDRGPESRPNQDKFYFSGSPIPPLRDERPLPPRPIGDRPHPDDRPYDRHPDDRPPFDRPPYDRPPKERPPYDRPPKDRPRLERPMDDRPPLDRPPMDRPPLDRPPIDRPPMDRPPMDRPPIDRPKNDRPPEDRLPRPPPPRDSPELDRPVGDRRPELPPSGPEHDKPKDMTPYNNNRNPEDDDPKRPRPESNLIPHGPKGSKKNSIVSQSFGKRGQTITSIITELEYDRNNFEASDRVDRPGYNYTCFRRVLAGKRVSRSYVKRTLVCERVEDCQQECAHERKFVCEGFNYRLDPSGRAQGECELVDIPLSRMDFTLDLFRDPDYDYYERDRDSMPDCRPRIYYPLPPPPPPKDIIHLDIRPHGGEDRYDRRPSGNNRRGDISYGTFHADDRRDEYHSYHYDYHRFDKNEHHHRFSGHHYPEPYRRPQEPPRFVYRPYLPTPDNENKKVRLPGEGFIERDQWGFHRRGYGAYGGLYGNFGKPDPYETYYDYNRKSNRYDLPHTDRSYIPAREPERPSDRDWKYGGTKDWGRYGGSYGNGGNFIYLGYKDSYDYWGFNRNEDRRYGGGYGESYGDLPPHRGRPPSKDSYQPVIGGGGSGFSYGGSSISSSSGHSFSSNSLDSYGNHLGGPTDTPKRVGGGGYNFLKDECSLRTATGFRLAKNVVRKFLSVHSIYECEIQCVKERDFICNSYSYRYTITLSKPTDNCYLSDRSYKALDFYTDLEPDRDFDIYTMNNPFRCEVPVIRGIDHSDCFWRVRSGQRLDSHIVKDTMNVKNIVECQIECLRAFRFTCRAFSYRYGPPVIGGVIDNCQLTDWPFLEMDPRVHMRPEPGFEIYDRGSYGHGCEPDHFAIRGKRPLETGAKTDQLCYVGYGTPARLLPSAIRKSIYVDSEFDCKQECSKSRANTLLQCMSFSFRLNTPKGVPNCELSDILQRDLLLDLDYTSDTNAWLFAWDNYNPECVSLAFGTSSSSDSAKDLGSTSTITISQEGRIEYESLYPLDIWRVYSVSGWPCRRGSLCQENKEAGFWFCELEGGGAGVWDYCCRPTHQCGYSLGYSYQWCYVGPVRTQWRKCSDRYYPYLHHFIDRNDVIPPEYNSYLPDHANKNPWPQNPPVRPNLEPPFRPGYRPDRPPARPTTQPPRPSLDEYEDKFEHQFLEPPKPGGFGTPKGFGQPRHWPVSYLHKEVPPNETTTMPPPKMNYAEGDKKGDPKFQAIQNLIDIIKSNDLNNIQYQITNHSNKVDDVLYVKIPLPTSTPNVTTTEKTKLTRSFQRNEKIKVSPNSLSNFEPIDVFSPINFTNSLNNSRVQNQGSRNSREQSTHNFFTPNPSGFGGTSTTGFGGFEPSFGTFRSSNFERTTETTKPTNFNSRPADFGKQSSQVISRRVDDQADISFTTMTTTPKSVPSYRKGFVVKTNVTNYGRRRDREVEYRFLV